MRQLSASKQTERIVDDHPIVIEFVAVVIAADAGVAQAYVEVFP